MTRPYLSLTFAISALLLAPGCSGDDDSTGGGTETSTSGSSTGSSTSTSTSTSTATSTAGDTDTDTSTATDTGTGDTGTGDTGTGDTGTGGSGTTGGATPCEAFCADYFATCGATSFNDYGTEADCVTTCEGWTNDQLSCRQMHLGFVQDPDNDGHCGHASADGGNVCP